MLIIADENMPFAREAFGALGEVRLMHGRKMTAKNIRDANLLMVRSITRVDRALLHGSSVRFVGTATIGTDHVDLAYLREAGIGFSAAPGSNANSVAEYITAALLTLADRQGKPLAGRSLGIVGVGNVGSRVAVKAQALGMRVLLNDPPLRRATGDPKYLPLDDLIGCDFITFHVPLEKQGPDATRHLVNHSFLRRMRPDAVLINSSRGAIADNAALLAALSGGRLSAAVLDVWEGEPNISPELLRRAAIATPHIAGYSYDGKVNGTEMIYQAACEFLGKGPQWERTSFMPKPDLPEIVLPGGGNAEDALRAAVLKAYPIGRDDAALRKLADLPAAEQGPYFDRLRKEYPVRREFPNTTVKIPPSPARAEIEAKLRGIGFKTLL
jgi:erythronate-4-phosphate dehydrogenase